MPATMDTTDSVSAQETALPVDKHFGNEMVPPAWPDPAIIIDACAAIADARRHCLRGPEEDRALFVLQDVAFQIRALKQHL